MTDTPPDDRPVDTQQDTQPLPDLDELKASDPALRGVGEKIEDAKETAREIFGEKSTADADSDEDLGGSAPVP
jgi:hypothetical protein